jgi:ABC-type multidrug transport system fused ATPase/permease subunit
VSELDRNVESLPLAAAGLHGDLAFERVSFSYANGAPVLRDVTFTAKPGQLIALVGMSGAGKTTIVSLIMRVVRRDCRARAHRRPRRA